MVWAVHLSDGVINWPSALAGWLVAIVLVSVAQYRLSDAELSRLGVMTAAFAVASQIHLPLGIGVSVHLLLNGLMGVILGRKAVLAIAVGLALQALLFGHGGLTRSLGVNIAIYSIPALLVGQLFVRLYRSEWLHNRGFVFAIFFGGTFAWISTCLVATQWVWFKIKAWEIPGFGSEWWVLQPLCLGIVFGLAGLLALMQARLKLQFSFTIGMLLGLISGYLTVLLNIIVLTYGGHEVAANFAGIVLLTHMPVIACEAIGIGFIVSFLEKARPDWLA